MTQHNFNPKAVLRGAAVFLAWSLNFAVAYAQAPLYTSNQNQYFLRGLTNAGLGYLHTDWLANTLDSTPLFSLLVEWSYRIFQTDVVFYFYYALLMGVYLFSIAGIVEAVFKWDADRNRRTLYLALLVVAHSALVRFLAGRLLGQDYAYLLEAGVAGQRLLGDVLQPSSFGVFLLLSICLFLRGRTWLATILLPLTASIHPTYLLSAAVLTAAYMLIIYLEKKEFKQSVLIGGLSLVLVIPIVAYTLNVFAPSDPELYAKTRADMVNFRIPHHAVIAEWFDWGVIFGLVVFLTALYLVRKSRLFWVLALLGGVSIFLTGVQAIISNDSLALLFPWRISALLFPLSTGILIGFGLDKFWPSLERYNAKKQGAFYGMLVVLLLGAMAFGVVRYKLEMQQKLSDPARPMMAYVANHLGRGQAFIIPTDMQDFRLVTGAPVVADFKSIPYKDYEFADWLTRIQNVNRFYRDPNDLDNCYRLRRLSIEFQAQYVVLPPDKLDLTCPGLYEMYNDGTYAVSYVNIPDLTKEE